MLAYTVKRILLVIPTLVGILVLVFGLMQVVPGDPAAILLGEQATAEAIAEVRHELGLDRPLPVQLGDYLWSSLRGDLGDSFFQNEPVTRAIGARLGATIELAVASLVFAIALGLFLGVVAAINQGSIIDVVSMLFAQLGVSMPVFWLGILLTFWFAVELNWLPAIGRGEPIPAAIAAALSGRPGVLLNSLSHLLLPAVALGLNSAAVISRLVRSSMLETLNEDYIRTAYAKGLPPSAVVVSHALRNALLPVISVIGLRFGVLLGGAVLTEAIFGWPGLGQLAVTSISQRDIPLVQGVVLVFALMFTLVNLAVDLLYGVIDPRIRFE
ncbi:MAG: ABC transporter permease [Proteobacteria bacterium]|nr:ABC transporter permease [Pseudomonadota bacterium]MCH8187563.1 ABC transporter permease [Pseudomonadota bacterium]